MADDVDGWAARLEARGVPVEKGPVFHKRCNERGCGDVP